MMILLLGLLAFYITVLLVIGLHEAGHAIAAACCGVCIQRITFGIGQPCFTWTDHAKREWVVARWPLGGSVQLLNSRIQPVHPTQATQCFDKKPVWMRLFVLCSGAAMNVMLAWGCLVGMHAMGYQQTLPIIKKIAPHSVAAHMGLHAGDKLLAFHHQAVASWQQSSMALLMAIGRPAVSLTIQSKTGHHTLILDLSQWRPRLSKQTVWEQLGITPALHYQHIQPPQAFSKACVQATTEFTQLLTFFLKVLTQILRGSLPLFLLTGPLGFFELATQAFLHHLSAFLFLIATCSLAVGITNLLPLPSLDGGSILYALLEKVAGRPISIAWELLLHRLATILLWVCIAQLLANDLRRLALSA